MKVYKLFSDQPAIKKHRDFASLSPKNRDGAFISSHVGNGMVCPEWRKIELYVYNPADPKPDFYAIGSNWVLTPNAFERLQDVLTISGQLLPLTVEAESGTHFLYNCTTIVDALDPEGSIWLYYKETKRSRIDVPSFHADRLETATVFMLPRPYSAGIYVVERSGDYRKGEFKAMVEHHGLLGLRFDLIWSSEEGPASPAYLYDTSAPMEHRTATGKPWIFAASKRSTARKERPKTRKAT